MRAMAEIAAEAAAPLARRRAGRAAAPRRRARAVGGVGRWSSSRRRTARDAFEAARVLHRHAEGDACRSGSRSTGRAAPTGRSSEQPIRPVVSASSRGAGLGREWRSCCSPWSPARSASRSILVAQPPADRRWSTASRSSSAGSRALAPEAPAPRGGDRTSRGAAPWLATSRSTSVPRTRSSTRAGSGIILNEPTVIALNSRTQDVLAMGHEAWQMIGRTPGYIVAVRPLRGGAITDFEITQRMIRLLFQRAGVNRLYRARVLICVPSAITHVEQRAVLEAARRAGAAQTLPASSSRWPPRSAPGCRSTSRWATWSSTSAAAPPRSR